MSLLSGLAPSALAEQAGTPVEVMDAITELERLKSQACAAQARLAARLDDRARVDAALCGPDADGCYRFEGWGDRRLVAEALKLVAGLDPQALVNRRAHAEAERRVSLRPAPDTMAQLSALPPVTQGVAVWATLSAVADQAVASGDGRSRGQVMADTLVERITGQATATAVPITINLVVSDQALLGGGHEPAWLIGHGPIPADAARDLARTAIADATAALRRLYAVPETGELVAMDSAARFFPAGLATFIELRDHTCRTPWCDAPIRQSDHAVPDAAGGATTALNGQGLCQQCNLAKEATGWRTRPSTGPPESLHTIETTLPTGHTIRSTAPEAPRPSTLRYRSDLEWQLHELILAC